MHKAIIFIVSYSTLVWEPCLISLVRPTIVLISVIGRMIYRYSACTSNIISNWIFLYNCYTAGLHPTRNGMSARVLAAAAVSSLVVLGVPGWLLEPTNKLSGLYNLDDIIKTVLKLVYPLLIPSCCISFLLVKINLIYRSSSAQTTLHSRFRSPPWIYSCIAKSVQNYVLVLFS